MNILFAASEARPFAASGGLADVIGSLPFEIAAAGNQVGVVLPLYKQIKPEHRRKMKYLLSMYVPVGWREQYCDVFTLKKDDVTFYFIDSQYYFARDGFYGFNDDCERYIFFSRSVMELIRAAELEVDIINANDWQTAMIPVFQQVIYKFREGFEDIKVVYTIHNIQYQGIFGKELFNDLTGIPDYHVSLVEFNGCVNMMKGAFETADCISTVSPQYAKEILDPWYAYGLDGILESKKDKLVGILNGINTVDYDPSKDKAIAAKYSLDNLKGKAKCKKALQKKMGLEESDKPLIGIVTRLVAHKGIGLIRYVFEDIIKSGAQAVILGSGEQVYEEFFREMHDRYRGDVAVHIGFDPTLARQIYAGADIFLMPSENEPCGLAQMIALRYGTIPIVRETGGLKDTIRDFDGSEGNGYSFKNCNAHELLTTVLRALQNYKDREGWDKLIHNAMSCDYSWTASAKKYIELYKGLTSRLS